MEVLWSVGMVVLVIAASFVLLKVLSTGERKRGHIEAEDDAENIIDILQRNTRESREYFIISKEQEKRTWEFSIIMATAGVILILIGAAAAIISGNLTSLYTTVGGVTAEVIAALVFKLHEKATDQLNLNQTMLNRTERYLTAIYLSEKFSTDKKDGILDEIVKNMIHFKSQG
ncbi:MAG: hypothetical protein AAGU74_09570 [Bacillota bacterium]